MDIALLLISVIALVMAIVCLMEFRRLSKDAHRKIDETITMLNIAAEEFKGKTKEMNEASAALSKLHNDQISKVKSMSEEIETLRLRFHGTNPTQKQRTF